MDLTQMRDYVAVVEEGSISAAAKKLDLTQPPVSMQIRLLEKELGCTLFERGSRRIRLTEEGRIFYEHAVRILNLTRSAADAVGDCRDAETGTLRAGVASSLVDLAAEKWFSGFAALHPRVNFELTEGNTFDLLGRLESRQLEAAFVRTPFSARGFTCYSLAPEDLLLVGADRLLGPLPGQVPLTRAAELPLIVYRRWAGVLDQAFASRGLRARFLCIADDARTCISWARLGLGVAVAPADILIAGGAGDLQTRVLRGLSPAAATTLAVRESGCDTAVGRAFVSYFLRNAFGG